MASTPRGRATLAPAWPSFLREERLRNAEAGKGWVSVYGRLWHGFAVFVVSVNVAMVMPALVSLEWRRDIAM